MKINYAKTCTLPQNLIPLLRNRGLSIPDEQRAISYLTNIGYFRLSAYFYPLLKEPKNNHTYKDDATFDLALDMYRFDRKLRLLLFNEIEKIEVALRSAMNNWISDELNDVFWMTEAKHFNNFSFFAKRLAIINSELDKSDEDFIIHFKRNYTNPYPPAWMIAEVVPFGVLCKTFNDLKYKSIQKKIANYFALSLPVFSSWTVSLVSLRNLCGHHNRTWNKEIPISSHNLNNPVFPWINPAITDMKRVYFRICIIKYLLFTVSPHNTFTQKLKSLLTEYPTIDIKAMGFPVNWQQEPLWK
ncbi:MAG: Abi family protein [Tannerella sp.]|jgi:abortive infection bacteriophage resistance protein|nr:Abi family protein [Tannerella sp.]